MAVSLTYPACIVSLLAYATLLVAFFHASVIDVKTRIVPASSLVGAFGAWAAAVLSGVAMGACPFVFSLGSAHPSSWVAESLAGGFLAGGISLASALVLERRSGDVALGGGDVKLLFVAGLYLGPSGGLAMLGAACMIALVFQGVRMGSVVFAWAVRRWGLHIGIIRMQEARYDAGECSFAELFRRPFAFVPFLTAALIAVLALLVLANVA